MDKAFIVGKLNEMLALEQGVIEVERMIARKSQRGELSGALEQAARDDDRHAIVIQRAILNMGGQVQPPPMESRAWIEALIRAANVERDELDRLGLSRMLKFRAVASGEVMDTIRRALGNPGMMEPLLLPLHEDREHAATLARLEADYAANEAVL